MRFIFSKIGLFFFVSFAFSNSLSVADGLENVEFKEKHLRESDSDDENDHIVGGTAAAPGEFPFQAALNLNGGLCGGTLISESIILTAAHCLSGKTAASTTKFSVTANTTSLRGGANAVTRRVRKFVVHGSYNSKTNDNDIALLALSSPIKNVAFVKLPPASAGTYAGNSAVIAGWGTTSSGGRISQTLLKATVTVLENAACNKKYGGKITSNMICAAAPGKDTCQGDSGGPLLVGGVQGGITSFGYGCADSKFPGVYTRVSNYVDWIKRTSANI
ncbi:trypsin alpha-3-like [Daphnia pulicaria]|uniref:trypsin alpha-3-like n=1 Tax=Daphnia pulicaria TaxID=35523 RepID=UPI001EECB3A2|nr:trypsin alpha-3-like [Daphnia pulicaria]